MEFSKFKSKYQKSLRSMFSLTQKRTLTSKQKQLLIYSLNTLIKSVEFFIFNWKLFCFSLKKNYLVQIIPFKEIKNVFAQTNVVLFFNKIKNSRNIIMLFFNAPLIISVVISEIFESIRKKTIYLYRFFLLFSIPVLIFCVNKTFVLQTKKDFLSFLLLENKKIFLEEKNSLYFNQLRKKILRQHILTFLSDKIKSFYSKKNLSSFFKDQISSFSYLPKSSEQVSDPLPLRALSERDSLKGKWNKLVPLYLKLKNNYSTHFENDCSSQETKVNKVNYWSHKKITTCKSNLKSFPFFSFIQIPKHNSFLKQEFLQKIDYIFFSFIKPRDLNYLNILPEKILSEKNSFFLDLLEKKISEPDTQNERFTNFSISREDNTNRLNLKTKNQTFYQSRNNRQWKKIIQQWMEFYSSKKKLSFLTNNKKILKENFQLFQNFKIVIHSFKNSFQKSFGKPLLNRANLSSIFVCNPHPLILRSYKKALNLNFSNFERSIFVLRNNSSDLEYFPFYIENINKREFLQKMNFLYTFSFHFSNDYIFSIPETFFLIQNTTNIPHQITKSKKNHFQFFLTTNPIFYDLDFYLKNYKANNDIFWIPSFSLHQNILEQQNNKIFASNSFESSKFTLFQQDLKLINKKRKKLQKIIDSTKSKTFIKYNNWIFTPQWWVFHKNELVPEIQSLVEDLTNLTEIFVHRFSTKIGSLNKNNLSFSPKFKKLPKIIGSQIQGWNKLLVHKIYTSPQQKMFWENLHFLTTVSNSSWSCFIWFIGSSIVYYHWLPMLTGAIYLYLWFDFEKIRSLSYPSWKTFLDILNHNSIDSPSQQLRLTGYLSKRRMFFIYNKLSTISNKIFFIFNRFNYLTTSDLSPRNKNVVSNSFITKKTLRANYYFWNINKQSTDNFLEKYEILNGFNFFQKWSQKKGRISSFLQKNRNQSFSLNWLNDLFFYNRFLSSGINTRSNLISINWKSKPTSLLEPLTYTQRWLFIGSLESGKSFVIKNLAASTEYPLIHLSIKDIKNSTPDSKYNKFRKQKRWAEQLAERSFLLENLLNLAKIVAPSLFWVSDLHDFDTKNQIQEKNAQKFDISLLMATLLKILSIDLVPEGHNKITFIGSTEYPRLVDPKFISRQRLDLIVNFRPPSFNQRQNIFTFLLKTKGFTIKGLRSFYELNSNTLGYTFRDLTSLVNETLLVKTTENTKLIDRNTIRLALYRQTSTQSVKSNIIRQENLQYKIGKALVQAILVYPKSIIFLSKYHDLWKTKFYYLAKTYLEVSTKKTITTEFVLLSQILNCLAGSAARDAWILSTKEITSTVPFSQDSVDRRAQLNSLSLTSQLKHDLSIASNLLQSLLVEFPIRDITSLSPKKKKNREDILKTFHFNFIKRAMSYLEFFDQFPSYINWSIKGKRLSFNWILFFSGIEHSTKNLARLVFLDKNKKNLLSPIFNKHSDINIPYERKETKRQQQKTQKIDSLFNKMVYTIYMENLGFPWESEYVMDYNPFQISLFFREARPLWNPQTIMPSYSILFFDRDLLINQKLLTKLYITYGSKFQMEKLNRKRIKKQFFWSNSIFNKVDQNKPSEIKKESGNSHILPQETQQTDFHFYQNVINLNAQLDQSQIELPVYLHEGWITTDPNETFRTFDLVSPKLLVNNNNLIYKESLLLEILLEVYHYLLNFFIKNKKVFIEIKDTLLVNEIVYRQDIENAMKKYYLDN